MNSSLQAQICKGKKLKKTQTNDRSAPVVSGIYIFHFEIIFHSLFYTPFIQLLLFIENNELFISFIYFQVIYLFYYLFINYFSILIYKIIHFIYLFKYLYYH